MENTSQQSVEIKLNNIVNSSRDWEYWISPDGTVAHMSGQSAKITGYKISEFVKNPQLIFQIIHPEDQSRLINHFESREEHKPGDMEFRIISKTGAIKWLAHSCNRVFSESGTILGTRVINRDITVRKNSELALLQEKESLERSNRDLEQFAYVAAHDLREPLVAIAAYLKIFERLSKKNLDEQSVTCISKAMNLVLRMDSMLQSFLSYSKHSNAMCSLEISDANACLNDALSNLAFLIRKSGAVVTSDHLPSVRIESSQLVTIFQNLISNSIKFRKSDPLRVHVGCIIEGSLNLFHVKDNGMGIEPPYLDRIFKMFERVHDLSGPGGAGIGLTICRRILERHGGGIWVDSKPGEGSTFWFTLPLAN